MQRKILFFFLTIASLLSAESIVFIQLGRTLPDYLPTAISQARAFNPATPIYVVVNQQSLIGLASRDLRSTGAEIIYAESLEPVPAHVSFKKKSRLDRTFRGGFWLYTTERFFYLHELIKQQNLTDVIHLESDVMLYTDISTLIPTLQKHYPNKIGATFDNNQRCIAGLLYIPNEEPLSRFTQFLDEQVSSTNNDMEFLAAFKRIDQGRWIDQLPILMPSYAQDRPLLSIHEFRGDPPEPFYNHFDEFQSIFDAAAIGQYLGGIDPRNAPIGPGFINEACVFVPTFCEFEWKLDEQGRRVPYAIYKNEPCKINNLHIHCKNLKEFTSK